MKILIVTPASKNSTKGNRVTALRWSRILQDLGHTVGIITNFTNQSTDLLIALHALKSNSSILNFRNKYPNRPLIITLTGTDLYRDIKENPEALNTLKKATSLIVLQPFAIKELPPKLQNITRVIFQSNEIKFTGNLSKNGKFNICVMGHLRDVKDPFLTAKAARLLPDDSKIELTHIGGALNKKMENSANAEDKSNPRYNWVGEIPRSKALQILSESKLLVHTSIMEGGANAVSEAISLGVPVISTEIPGSVGLLGKSYPGYFEVGDSMSLAVLLEKSEFNKTFYKILQDHCNSLQPLFYPEREREAWLNLINEISLENSKHNINSNNSRFQIEILHQENTNQQFNSDVEKGLLGKDKTLPCKYFYDEKGSKIFEQICELPEYYLTRTESRILKNNAEKIANLFSVQPVVVELGSGSSVKTGILLQKFLEQFGYLKYFPIDISQEILVQGSHTLLNKFPNLDIQGYIADYLVGLESIQSKVDQSKLILWLGSSIGNFTREESSDFLTKVRENMSHSDKLLIGIDLKKDSSLLVSAYNDSQGITAEFNLNVLQRIKDELNGSVELKNFRHNAIYNEKLGRVEMYLISKCNQSIKLNHTGSTIKFRKNEAIHTENSYKYSNSDIENLAYESNLQIKDQFIDSKNWFSVNILSPRI